MAQQSHCRVELPPPPIESKDRNRYFCPRVHRRLTHNSHKVAAAQCPVLAGWMDKKRGHRCTCNQRNAGACPLRSECPPTRLANIEVLKRDGRMGKTVTPLPAGVSLRSGGGDSARQLSKGTRPASLPPPGIRPVGTFACVHSAYVCFSSPLCS